MASPRFRHRLIRFRRFISGSLALASLNRACRDHRPDFSATLTTMALTTAACGSLGSAPDRRTRRALLHLSYSCAAPFGPAILVTQSHKRTLKACANVHTRSVLRYGKIPSEAARSGLESPQDLSNQIWGSEKGAIPYTLQERAPHSGSTCPYQASHPPEFQIAPYKV